MCLAGIGEVAGDAELEASLAVLLEIALTKAGRGELLAKRLDLGTLLTPRKLALELIPKSSRHGRGIDENETRWLDAHESRGSLACE